MNEEIKWIRSITPSGYRQPELKVGIGDDAAIFYQKEDKDTVIAVDTMVEGVHFKRETMPLHAIGHKALAANISDLAAMGAIPQYYLVSVAFPKKTWNKEELHEIYRGMANLAKEFSMDLIGGDTVSIEKQLVLTVTVIGKIKQNRHLLRSNARPGDVVFVTGLVGLASLGLEMLLEDGLAAANDAANAQYIKAHQEPQPQLRAGLLFAESGFRMALNDISDGLASEAKEIAEASQVDIELDWARIPTTDYIQSHSTQKQESWLLYGGEDYQLLGTVSEEDWKSLQLMFRKATLPLYEIGTVRAGNGRVAMERDGSSTVITATGYDHL
ncbi:thiamine-monophosphate kinase [Evansella caseinilytica]|uniref:Thiamine-monophosphate kinase n=1 Tax=Evansella caseinilytica TaxID=1503961 RepID=A0A1H3TJ20_9BACI|nr:thiamine-phosphate kinase [Evansella caseinilytica]SDZ50273.1 thiamine-monophosphate kinase [Evansella caseinilytica]